MDKKCDIVYLNEGVTGIDIRSRILHFTKSNNWFIYRTLA